MSAINNYTVRIQDGDGRARRCSTLAEAAAAHDDALAKGCADVRIFAVAEDGAETPLPTYEEALEQLEGWKAQARANAHSCEERKGFQAEAERERDEAQAELARIDALVVEAGIEARGPEETLSARVARLSADANKGEELVQAALDVGAPPQTNNEGLERRRRAAAVERFEALKQRAGAGLEHLRDPGARVAFNAVGPELAVLYARREELGNQIDAHDMAEPPTAPPEELVRKYQVAREQIAAAEKAARGTPRISVLPVEPLSTGTTMAFVDGPGRHGMEEIATATYPESPRGAAVRDFRQEHEIKLGDLARALRIGVADLSGIERGSKTTDDAGWREITTQMCRLGSVPEEERAAEAGYLADPFSRPWIERLLDEEEAPAETPALRTDGPIVRWRAAALDAFCDSGDLETRDALALRVAQGETLSGAEQATLARLNAKLENLLPKPDEPPEEETAAMTEVNRLLPPPEPSTESAIGDEVGRP